MTFSAHPFTPIAAITLLGLSACQAALNYDAAAIEADILTILDAQDKAWSAGDIEGFMESYWQSEDLRFASGGEVQRGWQGMKDRYYRRYPNPEVMGTLISGDHEIDVLASDAAVAHGSWRLVRDGQPASGLYTLVFKEIDGKWVITSDTTTSAQ